MAFFSRPWVSFLNGQIYSRKRWLRGRVFNMVLRSPEIRKVAGAKNAVIMYVNDM